MNVSVIIPVYNAEKYIRKAIESCLGLPEVKEIVVIDDGYKDGAKDIVKILAEKHHIIRLFEHANNENRGAGPSRNLGIEKATQEYLAFLDADDFFLPNRFKKDAEVFNDYPDADGCYNAIGCYFYSDKAKASFSKHFKSEITSVNRLANPTPDNLFKGLIGLIPDFGYFSIDGLTVKRSFLLKNNIEFPLLAVHQDTVFVFKVAHYGKLFPSELISPVTLRGVHEENRITENYQWEKKKQYNQFLMWNVLYDWAKKEKIEKQELNMFKQQVNVFKLLTEPSSNPNVLTKEIKKNMKLFLDQNYPKLHTKYFGNSSFLRILLVFRKGILFAFSKLHK